MLLDRILPEFDVRSRHSIEIDAPSDRVARVAYAYRLDSSPIIRVLLRLRGLGKSAGTIRDAMGGAGFSVIAEREGEEIVLGVAGKFWAVRERGALVRTPDEDAFRRFDRPGCAKAAMAFRMEPLAPGGPPRRGGRQNPTRARTRLSTETRVLCCDRAARRSFRLYWTLIGPFSGLIRREMLRGIARDARS